MIDGAALTCPLSLREAGPVKRPAGVVAGLALKMALRRLACTPKLLSTTCGDDSNPSAETRPRSRF